MLGKINFEPTTCDPLTLDNCPLCGKKWDGSICKKCMVKLFGKDAYEQNRGEQTEDKRDKTAVGAETQTKKCKRNW